MSDIGRFFGLGHSHPNTASNGHGNNRASTASSGSDSTSTVRVEHPETASSRTLRPPPSPMQIPAFYRPASTTPQSPKVAMPLPIPLQPEPVSIAAASPRDSMLPPPRPPPPQRTRSAVGLFRVPSYLSLRSNSNGSTSGGKQSIAGGGGSGRAGGSADSSRAPTPLPGSLETTSAFSWFDFNRRGNLRDASGSAGSTGSTSSGGIGLNAAAPDTTDRRDSRENRQKCGNNNLDGSSFSPSLTPLPLLPPPHTTGSSFMAPAASPSSSSSPAVLAARNRKWANTFVPIEAEEDALFMPKSPNDFLWHRPSLLHIVESLQVALLSGEMDAPASSTGSTTYPATPLSSSPVSLSRRRSSTNKVLQPAVPTGHSDAIPGRYRSHIAYLIESVRMLQDKLDQAESRAVESRKAHEQALARFSELSNEWAVREKGLMQDIQQLRGALEQSTNGKAKGPTLAVGSTNSSFSASDGTQSLDMHYAAHFQEATQMSSAKREDQMSAPDKWTRLPALISDFNHDKAISDQLLRTLVAEQGKSGSHARRGPKPDPLLTASKTQVSMAQEAVIERLQQSIQRKSHCRDYKEKGQPPEKRRGRQARAVSKSRDGHISHDVSPELGGLVSNVAPSTSGSLHCSPESPATPASSSTTPPVLSSSSSSDSEDYPGTYESEVPLLSDITVQARNSQAVVDHAPDVQDENLGRPSPEATV